MHELIYQTSPRVEFATNLFINVPIILQFDDTPLVAVVREEKLGYTTEIPIYHSDGTYLAKVRGTRIFATKDGEKAGLEMRQLPQQTVCTLAGRPVFEIEHRTGDSFRAHAELYTPGGYFVRAGRDHHTALTGKSGQPLQVGGVTMLGNTFHGVSIGVLIRSDGSVSIGVS